MLLDYLDIVVHVQHEEERQFYALERLWHDCPAIALPADVVADRAVTAARSSCSGTAGPRGTPSGRAQGQADIALDDTAARRPAAAAAWSPLRPGAAVVQRPRPGAARRRRTSPRRRARPSYDARLREYDLGVRTGLTRTEYAATHPREYAAVPLGDDERAGRG